MQYFSIVGLIAGLLSSLQGIINSLIGKDFKLPVMIEFSAFV